MNITPFSSVGEMEKFTEERKKYWEQLRQKNKDKAIVEVIKNSENQIQLIINGDLPENTK